ncbi:helix-turn-helix domain-containing protein [Lewinella sp. W8]|uniref:AlbA family DNA-binding domain-containing protein n=1 Tax=Lewinella sp. W8 TaxID=2528208 RepID=UPI0010677482|nr:ATP-binding protein [Lewinella sp. W8]MTB53408.1 hypothetical protein [Lewinella sp. W8]
MVEKLIEIIEYHSESVHVDFKAYEYPLGKHPKKNELLKDISAMANHPSKEPKYILVGVKELDGMASEFVNIESPTDQASYQQFVEDNIEPRINFAYRVFEYKGYTLSAFIISNNEERPYLFRKHLRRTDGGSQEFRIGDGFIRTGTSTRKLSRKDYEEIYTKRLEARDRVSDLKVTPFISKYFVSPIKGIPSLFLIDFMIENLSRKSIGFDAELRLQYKEGISLQKKFDFKDKTEDKGLSGIYPQHFPPKIDLTILDLEIEQQHDSYKVSRLRKASESYAVTISQRDREENIFLDEILIGALPSDYAECMISIELILRSDDFQQGPIHKKYYFDLKEIINGA